MNGRRPRSTVCIYLMRASTLRASYLPPNIPATCTVTARTKNPTQPNLANPTQKFGFTGSPHTQPICGMDMGMLGRVRHRTDSRGPHQIARRLPRPCPTCPLTLLFRASSAQLLQQLRRHHFLSPIHHHRLSKPTMPPIVPPSAAVSVRATSLVLFVFDEISDQFL